MANILDENDVSSLRTIDQLEKNKFRYDWLSKSIKLKHGKKEAEITVGNSIKKVDVSGKAICTLCTDYIYYGKRGFSAIFDHLKTKKHSEKVFAQKVNYTLPSNFFSKPASSSTLQASCIPPPQVNVPLCDRVSNLEGLIIGVLAEHNLPFTMASVLIDVSKALASDKKALGHLKMQRNCASYKMRFGVANTFLQETVSNMQKIKFSLNIDEATSNNYMRVLCILVSYFSPCLNKVVVEHLVSLSVTKVNAEYLFKEICNFFQEHNIPWDNCMSLLMDSCSVMRGSKSGLETRIRKSMAPHLLDIDGDSCHHIHNACKRFCSPFDGWLEKLMSDIFNDMKWSADLREWLAEICFILNVKYTTVVNMVPHRWLSCYDAALGMLHLLDALTAFYYSFLVNSEKTVYFAIICNIFKQRDLDFERKSKIKQIQKMVSEKALTDDGKKRKARIVMKLFHHRRKTQMILNFYTAVLPLLKKYVCLFQTKEPLIHKVYDEQKQLYLDFLACFIKQELIQGKTTKVLLQFDVSVESNQLAKNKMFIGEGTKSIISNYLNDKITNDFLGQVKNAYVKCAEHLKMKLPLDSILLKCISAIDPTARGHAVTLQRLQKLPQLISNVLRSEEEREGYALEVHQYQVDMNLPTPIDDTGNIISIDNWWSLIFGLPKYSNLSKIVKSVISCFHGPQVESAFSIMGDVIDKKSGRMKIETYSAIQTVKYKMLSQKKSALQYFKKDDFLHQPVDRNLCQNLRSSRKAYQRELDDKKNELVAKKHKLNIKQDVHQSKQQSANIIKKAEEGNRLAHKRKLELLVQRVQQKKQKKY